MEKLFTPVFAGGTGRSGTTIIVNLLSWHPEFHTSMPRGLVQGIELSVLDEAFRVFEVEYKKDVSKAARNFYYTLSSSQIMKPEIKFFADSTPTNIINAKFLHLLLPRTLFISMIRGGRNVALSVSKERWGVEKSG